MLVGKKDVISKRRTRRCWQTQMVRNLPAMQETQVGSLGQKDPLEKEMTTHSSILAWKNRWTEDPGGLESIGSQKSQT